MKRFCFYPCLLLFLLWGCGCGKKGPIYPPVKKIPKTVEICKVIQRGNSLLLDWTLPTAYIDGSPLSEIKEWEIWSYAEKKEEGKELTALTNETFSSQAVLLLAVPQDKFTDYHTGQSDPPAGYRHMVRLKSDDISQKRFTFAFKVKDVKGTESAFSTLMPIDPQALPLAPQELQAKVSKDKIEIAWKPPDKNIDDSSPVILKGYNLYRSVEGNEPQRINSQLVTATTYSFSPFIYDTEYRFFVRASASQVEPYLESLDSVEIKVLPKDTFAPDPPQGLMAIAGENYISLSWDIHPEKDVAGYKVWRKKSGSDSEKYQLLNPELIKENSFMDYNAKKDTGYDYAVTACDQSGNESRKSKPVSERISGEPHANLPI